MVATKVNAKVGSNVLDFVICENELQKRLHQEKRHTETFG
jgi:hypothetical protein